MIKDKALKLVNELIAENKALKAALAQPAQKEPLITFRHGCKLCGELNGCEHKQPAQQEPVAWLTKNKFSDEVDLDAKNAKETTGWSAAFPVYTTPQQRPWVGLTEEDREKFDEDQLGWNDLLTAADALLKEKNNG
jgi:hypothetical protein